MGLSLKIKKQILYGAGNETRTRNPQLGRLMLYQLSYSRNNICSDYMKYKVVEGGGFEPPKSLTTDLQSVPFGHSGTPPQLYNHTRILQQSNLLDINQVSCATGAGDGT